ncbi:hypothetical protein LPJ59_000292 [Coemansia sp. RSA 2399]|nr:hypothetical protein LPJ59_000292 [Coemansia sp. RSA 2399]KAJ1904420.1 hypothetical protein LPJ81_002501 [Coemansia sp. IMI 209127]
MAMFLSRKPRSNNKAPSSRRRAIDDLSCMACAPQNTFRFTDSQAMDVAMVLAEEYVRTASPCPFEPKLHPIEPTSPEPSPQVSESAFPSPSCMLSPRAAATLGLRTINEELASADCDATPLSSMIPPFPRPPRGNVFAAAPLPSPASTLRVPSNQQHPPPAAFLTQEHAFLSLPLRSTRTRARARVPTSNTSRIVSSSSTVYGSESFPGISENDASHSTFTSRRSRFSLRAKNTFRRPAIKDSVRWIRRLFA